MGFLYNCGVCCMLLSIWAVIQLVIMGVFFKMEVLAFIEEAHPHHDDFEDFDDFMKKTKQNYHSIAFNCWIGAIIYVLCFGISWLCMQKAKSDERIVAEKMKDDDVFCQKKTRKFTATKNVA